MDICLLIGESMSALEPASAAPPREQVLPLERRAKVLIWILALLAIAHIATITLDVLHRGFILDLIAERPMPYEEVLSRDSQGWWAWIALSALQIAAIPAFMAWFFRAYSNLGRMGEFHRYKPGWAIGCWFVPILNLFRPKQMMNDIWHATEPGTPHDRSAGQRSAVAFLITFWWLLFLVSDFVTRFALGAFFEAETLDQQLQADTISALDGSLSLILCAVTLAVVITVTRRHDARAAELGDAPGNPECPDPTAESRDDARTRVRAGTRRRMPGLGSAALGLAVVLTGATLVALASEASVSSPAQVATTDPYYEGAASDPASLPAPPSGAGRRFECMTREQNLPVSCDLSSAVPNPAYIGPVSDGP